MWEPATRDDLDGGRHVGRLHLISQDMMGRCSYPHLSRLAFETQPTASCLAPLDLRLPQSEMDGWEGYSSVDASWHRHLMATGQVSAAERSQHALPIPHLFMACLMVPHSCVECSHLEFVVGSRRQLHTITKTKLDRPVQPVYWVYENGPLLILTS